MSETIFRQKTGGMLRFIISPLFPSKDRILCSVVNVTDAHIADEEIRQTLEDLERQVRERTAHLEKINEELRAEIMERRKLEHNLLSGELNDECGHKEEK
jgi:C4-dicarboxylate-specific signal transduction histidine kinase